jgi:hypothetical protein
MSLDERLRSTLSVVAERSTSAADIDAAFERVVGRSVRAKRRRHAAALIAAGIIVIAGIAVVNSRDVAKQQVNIGPVSTTLAEPKPVAAQTAFCPDRYRFGYVPSGWSATSDGFLEGSSGAVKLAAVSSSSATTVVRQLTLVGFPATERTDGRGVLEVRLDDEMVEVANTSGQTATQRGSRTDPGCGGELAVVASGLTEEELALVVNGVTPTYSLAERQSFRAVFPSSDLEHVASVGRSGTISQPEQVVNAFAGWELGWANMTTVDRQPSENGTGGADLLIEGGQGDPRVAVTTIPVPGTGYWAVVRASSFLNVDYGLSVGISLDPAMPDTVASGFADAASAQLTIRYGDVGVDLTTQAMPPLWKFEIGPRPDIPGALEVRWRDSGGRVVAVHATSVPPGDFAAG